MNYGLHISAAGLLTGLSRFDVAANNLANVETPAFKRDFALLQQRDAARIEDGLFFLDSNALLERLGAGPLVGRTRQDFSPAPPLPTGNPLDVALRSEGFFVVRGPSEGEGDEGLRFTRDGRFTRDSSGRLVMAATGQPVMDVNDQPIFLGASDDIRIASDGAITQEGRTVARLQVARPPGMSEITKAGDGLYAVSPQAMTARQPVAATIEQFAVEASGMNPVDAMLAMSKATGAISANVSMLRAHDQILERAINGLGRIN